MISNLQIRAARALLGWSQVMLADRAGLSPITVKRLEASDDVFEARFSTVVKVKSSLEEAGVVFIAAHEDRHHGVELRARPGPGQDLG